VLLPPHLPTKTDILLFPRPSLIKKDFVVGHQQRELEIGLVQTHAYNLSTSLTRTIDGERSWEQDQTKPIVILKKIWEDRAIV